MVAGSGNFPELLWPGIVDIWQTEYDNYEPIFSRIFSVKKSDKRFEKRQGIINIPMAERLDEGGSIAFLDPMQGYQKEIVNFAYGIGSGITLFLYQDNQYDTINDIPRMLAESMRETQEVTHHVLLNTMTTTTTTADGVAAASTAHVMVDSGVGNQSNMGQSGVTYALSQTSLEAAINFMGRWLNDRGFRINVRALTLVVPTELQFTAEKILKTEYEVNTNNNTINPMKGRLKLVVSPYITSTTQWTVLSSENDKGRGFISQDRMTPDLDKDSEFTTRNMLFSSVGRWGAGALDWRAFWHSTGT